MIQNVLKFFNINQNLNSKNIIDFIDENDTTYEYLNYRQQLDDVQKVLSSEQSKFNEECSKLYYLKTSCI